MWQASKDHPLEVAIHWFASGVKATILEDQFQLFWFAAELLAAHGKDTANVNDLCAICHKPLYCETCDTHPKHRPYQKQAIEQMICAIVGEKGEETSERLFKIRNMIMHGSTRPKIEAEIGGQLADSLEDIARITKQAIFLLLQNDLAKTMGKVRFNMLQVRGYAHTTMALHALMSYPARTGHA